MLYIPLVSQLSLDGNAGFQEFFALSDRLRELGERVYWYVVMPSWVTDGLRGHDRMQYVYIDSTRDHGVNDVVGFPAFELAQYFARRGGKFIVDGVLSNCVPFSSYVSRLLSDPVAHSAMPVFVRDHDEEEFQVNIDRVADRIDLAATYIGCHVGLQSDAQRSLLSSFVTTNTNPAMSRVFKDNSFLWPVGYDLDQVDEYVVNANGSPVIDVPVLFVGGDFDQTRSKRRELEIAQRLFALTKVDVLVTSRSPRYKLDRVLPKGDTSFIGSVGMRVGLDSYRRSLAKGHLFVSVSNRFNTLAGEEEIGRLVYGQVGVFPHEEWAIGRLGPDYPFYYNTGEDDEAVLLAEWIVKNYEDAAERIVPTIQKLRTEQSLGRSVDMAWGAIQATLDERYRVNQIKGPTNENKQPLFLTVYQVASKLGDEFSLDVFLDVMEEHLPWLKPWGRKGSLKVLGDVPQALPTLYDIRVMLDNLGWVDQCDGPNIVVRREREPLPDVHMESLEHE
jgi:hypothetical protein